MKKVLIFYHPSLFAASVVDGEEIPATNSISDVKALANKGRSEGVGVQLRDVTFFDGTVETVGGQLPDAVLLFGSDDNDFEAVREAYASKEVIVSGPHKLPVEDELEDSPLRFSVKSTKASDDDDEGKGEDDEKKGGEILLKKDDDEDESKVDELSALKARATELGLNFAPSIGVASLKARVEAKEKELNSDD